MKGMGRKKLKHLKYVSSQEARSKNVAIIEQKRKTICLYTNQEHLSTKVTS